MIQGGSEKNRMGSKRNTGKKRRALEKTGEHRKNEELSKYRKAGRTSKKSGVFSKVPGKGKSFEKSW